MSAATATTSRSMPARLRSSVAVFSSFSSSRPLITRWTPSSARASAHARPSPWLDAQTMPRRPAMPRSILPTLDTLSVARQRKVLPSITVDRDRGTTMAHDHDGWRSLGFRGLPPMSGRVNQEVEGGFAPLIVARIEGSTRPSSASRRTAWCAAGCDRSTTRRCRLRRSPTPRSRSCNRSLRRSESRLAFRSTRRNGGRGRTSTSRSGVTASCSTTLSPARATLALGDPAGHAVGAWATSYAPASWSSTSSSRSSRTTTTPTANGCTSCRSTAPRAATSRGAGRSTGITSSSARVVFDGRIVTTPTFMGSEPRSIGNRSWFDQEEEPGCCSCVRSMTRSAPRRDPPFDHEGRHARPRATEPVRREAGGWHGSGQQGDPRIRASLPPTCLTRNAGCFSTWPARTKDGSPTPTPRSRWRRSSRTSTRRGSPGTAAMATTTPFYYRVHSPVTLIEFDHHDGVVFDNIDPSRHHIHMLVRTPNGGDYGPGPAQRAPRALRARRRAPHTSLRLRPRLRRPPRSP